MARKHRIIKRSSRYYINNIEDGRAAVVDYVKLRDKDLEQVIEILQQVTDYKARALSSWAWDMYYHKYLPKILESVSANRFKIARADNNAFTWIRDQIEHSRQIQTGVDAKHWPPLAESSERVINLINAASRGSISYQVYCQQDNQYGNLFTS